MISAKHDNAHIWALPASGLMTKSVYRPSMPYNLILFTVGFFKSHRGKAVIGRQISKKGIE